jgi:hypothetical protein
MHISWDIAFRKKRGKKVIKQTDVYKSLRAITSDIMFEGKRPRAIKKCAKKKEKKKKREEKYDRIPLEFVIPL